MQTRRHLLQSSAAAAFLAAPAGSALAGWEEDVAGRLQRDLERHVLRDKGTRVSVLRVKPSSTFGLIYFDAIVEMQWSSGLHRRPIASSGVDGEAAYQSLLARSLEEFRKANPQGFA